MNAAPIFVSPGTGQGGDPGPGGHVPLYNPANPPGPIFNPPPLGAGPLPAVTPAAAAGTRDTGGNLDTGQAGTGGLAPINSPVAGAIDFLNTPGPFGLTYGQLGLIALAGLVLISGGARK